jgi:ABC-type transporter Mla subunit MlaD
LAADAIFQNGNIAARPNCETTKMPHFDPQTLQIVVAAVVAGTLLLQVILLVVILFGVRKAATAVREDLENIRASVTPLLNETHELLTRVGPKIEATTDDLAVITHSIREQTASVQSTVTEISERARHQASRVDFMLTTALDKVDHAGAVVNNTVAKPLRQVTGILAALRAVVETLRAPQAPGSKPPVNGPKGDSGMFI